MPVIADLLHQVFYSGSVVKTSPGRADDTAISFNNIGNLVAFCSTEHLEILSATTRIVRLVKMDLPRIFDGSNYMCNSVHWSNDSSFIMTVFSRKVNKSKAATLPDETIALCWNVQDLTLLHSTR